MYLSGNVRPEGEGGGGGFTLCRVFRVLSGIPKKSQAGVYS